MRFKLPTRQTSVQSLAGLALLLVGGFFGWLLANDVKSPPLTFVRAPQAGYALIDPVLYTSVPENAAFPEFSPLKSALTRYAADTTRAGTATDVSIYYRDLNSSRWVGANTTDTFWPASMLKVVTLMTVLKAGESNSSLLYKSLTFSASLSTADAEQDFFPPEHPILSGQTYSIDDLLTAMIEQSDNNANTLLTSYIGDAAVSKTFTDLHVPEPDPTTGAGITAQEYSHLFRVLYNATYLSPADSEKALELLSKTTFSEGLVAGVPGGTEVAHKFGETTRTSAGGSEVLHELHDCGIVYFPAHPYFLCVMSRGADYDALAHVISGVSTLVWNNVKTLYGNTSDPESGYL